jgi:fructokinase
VRAGHRGAQPHVLTAFEGQSRVGRALSGQPVIFGEVLFDRFQDGTAVLGGAPFNVAWHLQGFGLTPLLVSRVGEDALGERVRAAMSDWGMDLAGLQRDPAHPTGTVQVELVAGQPRFSILSGQAYDHIDPAAALQAIAGRTLSCLYHGTLAARHDTSRAALDGLRQAGLPTFVDLNLRSPWWSPDGLKHVLQGARWVKLNDEELLELGGLVEHAPPAGDLTAAADVLRTRYGLALLVVTLGAEGARLLSPEALLASPAPPVEALQDTVGAGDAFSAVMLVGLHRGWSLVQMLERALAFAARICGQRGATARDPTLYCSTLEGWEEDAEDAQ